MLLLGWLLVIAAGCTHVVQPPVLRPPQNAPDSSRDVRKVLDSLPGFSLFAQAFNKAAISGLVDPAGFYTIFLPTDSAMTAAGLTAAMINSLPADSLAYLVKYHITYGAVSDTTLTNALVSLQQNCLLETTFFNPIGTSNQGYSTYRHRLYVKYYGGVLNVNGWAVNRGELPVKAANGYLYVIHQVLPPPSQLLWDIVKARPELSYYVATLRFMDSIYVAISGTAGLTESDSALFQQVRMETVSGANYNSVPSVCPTVFAPTNIAFINAGFPDILSIQQYLLNGMRMDTVYPYPGDNVDYVLAMFPGTGYKHDQYGNYYTDFNYFPLDSVFKLHYLYNPYLQQSSSNTSDLSLSNLLTYSDLMGNPSINNGMFNVNNINNLPGNNAGVLTPDTLRFSSAPGGLLNIQWNPAGSNNALLPPDKSQQERIRSLWAYNGVIYESDRLFLYTR